MKNLVKVMSVAFAFVAIAGLALAADDVKPASKTTKFKLEGACCGHCDANLAAAVKKLAGVTECKSDNKAAMVTVTYDPAKTNEAVIEKAVAGTKNCHGQECKILAAKPEAPKAEPKPAGGK